MTGPTTGLSLEDRWDRFWFGLIPSHIYALLRVTLGLVGLLTLIRLADMSFWSLEYGLIADRGLAALKASLRLRGLGSATGGVLYAVSFASFLAMTLGFRCSVSVPLALISQLVQLSWNALPLSGAHTTLQSLLFCLMWADSGSVWSVDSWLEKRRLGVPTRPALASIAPLRMLRYQVALIYLVTGLWKLYNPLWRNGSAVHYVLNTNTFHRFPSLLSPSLEWLGVIASYMTLGWELSFAFLLFWRPTRIVVLGLGILMHLGILATMEVGPFHFVMLAAYPAFLSPEFVAGLSQRLYRGRRAAEESSVATAT